jgi:putative chitinase
MRFKEFITEFKKRVNRDGITIEYEFHRAYPTSKNKTLWIKALDAGSREMGSVNFRNIGNEWEGDDLYVDDRFRGQGIATIMYDFAKETLGRIVPSNAQTDDGKSFWQGKEVWENRLDEFAPSPERDHNDDVPDPIFVLANRWWNATDRQPQIEHVLNSLGWSIHQVESEDDAVQLQHRDGTTHFISADDFDPDLHEDWKSALGGAALAGAMALGGTGAADAKSAPVAGPSMQQQAAMSPIDKLKTAAQANGIKGVELAQFLAQCAHESGNFKNMEEVGTPAYFTKKYEQHKKTARILGNKVKGDGERYKGRGYIQLTGRDNYTRAGAALGLPLAQQPQLAARPDVAAKVAVWYWQNRVAPKIKDFANTKAVTKKINPASKGLQSRQDQFKSFQVAQR